MPKTATTPVSAALAKCPSGIRGLDLITAAGLPCGRPILLCGGAGTGHSNLDGLILRLSAANGSRGANLAILRAEMHRLFGWLKDRGISTLFTADRSGSRARVRAPNAASRHQRLRVMK